MKRDSGFTLIELMIVVAIIAIIAAIAIPNLLRSRMSANEASAVGSVRTITAAETGYQTAAVVPDATTGIGQYGTLAQLAATTPPFVDTAIGTGTKAGFSFIATPVAHSSSPQFTTTARPATPGRTGTKSYFADDSGGIQSGDLAKVHDRLGVARPGQHATGVIAQREQVPRPGEVLGLGVGVDHRPDAGCPISRGDSSGGSHLVVNRNREGGLMLAGGFLIDH